MEYAKLISKEVFISELTKLYLSHERELPTIEVMKLWFEECKTLREVDFKVAVNRSMYASRNPKLYDILINLPRYDRTKHFTIKEYTDKEYKAEFIKRNSSVPDFD